MSSRRVVAACAAFLAVAGGGSAHPLAAQVPGVDVLRYRFAIDLPRRGTEIAVRATLTVSRAQAIRALPLDLLAPMQVTEVEVGCARPRAPCATPSASRCTTAARPATG
jgi:hypothetical protein